MITGPDAVTWARVDAFASMDPERGGARPAASHEEVIDLMVGPAWELGGVERVVRI